MKKYLFYILSFIFVFVLFGVTKIEAKSVTQNEVSISFGDGDILNLNYLQGSVFKIRENSDGLYFYYDGVKHTLSEDYRLVDDSIEVSDGSFLLEGETLSIDTVNMLIISNSTHEFYGLSVGVEFSSIGNTYSFSQTLCYKYDDVQECNGDEEDTRNINKDEGYNFYYDFLPFYDENIKFDYLTYKFTLEKDNITYNLEDVTFNKDEINYNEYFLVGGYNLSLSDDKKYYISTFTYSSEPNNLYAYAYFTPGYTINERRSYLVKFYVCVGQDYLDCEEVYSNSNQTTLNYQIYTIPLSNIEYNSETKMTNYNSFKLKGSYVCVSDNCDEYNRSALNTTSTNEEIYYLNLSNPVYEGEINGKQLTCNYFYTCYGVSGEITNKVLFSDDNGITKVYYYLAKERISSVDLINIEIENDYNLTIGNGLDGYYYLYYKVVDGSGITSSNLNQPYIYLFDSVGPILSSDNFATYSSESSYNKVTLTVNYDDNYFNGAYKIFYKVISESEYSLLTKQEVIESNEYSNGVKIEENITEDGVYRVCFVGMDYLENYGDMECSNRYYLDITKLSKDEVSVTKGNEGYASEIEVNISILQVEEGVSFKCDFVLSDLHIASESELKSTCYNKKSITLKNNSEGSYNLWIYTSDAAGNYNLIKLDEMYLIDGLAPRVSYLINGDNEVYSNDVSLKVSVIDISEINLDSLAYVFYTNKYNESDFVKFNLQEEILYPYNYYGTYKVAIKACDILNNCNINTYDDTFLIDTAIIKISLIGDEEITILRWGKYQELGASATKGNATVSVDYRIEGELDPNKVGVYYLTYISGEGMNLVSVTRKVIVKDSMPYLLVFASLFVTGAIIISLRLFVKKGKNDTI